MSQSRPQQQSRPSYFRRLSSYVLSNANGPQTGNKDKSMLAQVQHQRPSERSPLLSTSSANRTAISTSASDDFSYRLLSNSTVIARPRAATVAAPTRHESSESLSPSRRSLGRAITSTATLTGRSECYSGATRSATMERPSILTRAAHAINNHLELGDGTSYAHRNAPPPPSYWNDNAHQRYLVRLWDAVNEQAANAKYTVSTTARVVSTEKSMLHHFPELAKGDRSLTRDWVEYVLGVALRHPFCTAEKMGRWEILASSSGARGTWGPW